MRIRLFARTSSALLFLASTSFSQTNFPEIEPNSVKAEATPATGMTANDTLSGTCSGTGVVAGDSGLATSDVYRVQTAALPLGIYKHRLTITTSGTAGHIGTIRGVNQTGTAGAGSTGGTAGTTDSQIQVTATTTAPPRFNQWYAFGKAEEIYYRVQGATTTTAPYTVTLTTFPVTATVIAQTFDSATPITITTIGQTTADTEVFVFDSNLDAIPGYSNDDDGPLGPGGLQSELTRTYASGTYYLAMTSYPSSWSFVSPGDDDIFVASPLMDFPGSLVRSGSGTTALDWDFTITGSSGTWSQTAQLPANSPYDTLWFRFTVTSAATSFCVCDGSGAPAPCGNPGATGRGCGSQVFPGGALLSSSGNASDETVSGSAADTLVLTASDIPGPALFIQANATGLINPFGDGHLCATTGIIRMGVVFPTGTSASYPGGSTAGEIHIVGFASAGQTKHYQAWYRSVPGLCTSGQNYNLTNGLSLVWQN